MRYALVLLSTAVAATTAPGVALHGMARGPASAAAVAAGRAGRRSVQQPVQQVDTGYATFYAASLHGRRTASGERFDNHALMAAHPSLPFGSIVRVTNLANQRSVDVRIVDRGPSAEQVKQGYVIDLSRAAAARLRMRRAGRVRVRIEVMRVGPE